MVLIDVKICFDRKKDYFCNKYISMVRKKKPLPVFENVEITGIAAEGKAITRVNDMVVFVPLAAPGDIVDLKVTRKKHSYCEAQITRFIEYSKLRKEPFCEHFGICGGCKWQHIPYEEQLKAKQQQVYDQLTRIGKLNLSKPEDTPADSFPQMRPILASEKTQAYRNKLEFGCSNKRWLTHDEVAQNTIYDNMNAIGFHISGAFDKIYPIEKCWLMDDLHNEIRNAIRDYALENDIPFYDLRQQDGLLRGIMIRNSNDGEWMLLIQFCMKEADDHDKAMGLMAYLAERFPQISSLLYVDNQKCNDTFGDLDISLFKGKDHIIEKMGALSFKVGPKSFYQTNTDQAYNLYKVARDFAFSPIDGKPQTDRPLVYDLYTGTGTIANFVASQASKVIGIEYVAEAIDDAIINSKINDIENTMFFAGDMKDILTDEFISCHGKPDVVITDPPRAGMHPDVIDTILKAAPERIVYVSCNPATQARDIALLSVDYDVRIVQPVDMFPHTPHVENVVQLVRRSH